MKHQWLHSASCVVIALFVLSAVPCYALRPEQEAKQTQPASLARKQVIPIRLPSDTQLQLAKDAEPFGVTVEWDNYLGTPSSIRGPDLGQRQAFSRGKGLTVKGMGLYEQDAIAVLDNLAGLFDISDAEAEFTSKKPEEDTLGFHHVRITQVYQGLKVIGGQVIVHFNNKGEAYEVNGNYVPAIDIEVTPSIDSTQAVNLAQADLSELGKPDGTLVEDPDLVVFAFDSEPALAYEITLAYNDQTSPGRWRYWIDAKTGTILLRFNDIKEVSAPTDNGYPIDITGNILSGEGGDETNFYGWYENTNAYFYLYNTNRHWYIYNVASSGYTDNNTYAYRTNSAWGTNDRAEVSAANNFDAIQEYFSAIHSRNSFDNSNAYARANVHQGTDYVNAYWDGYDFHFGDGDGSQANSLAVLDVSGHEFTHAVTEYTADLLYYGESGALNESFSDIFGACVEFYAQTNGSALYPSVTNGQADWLMGEDCWLEATALRDMRNPGSTNTLASGDQQPSRYHGTNWYYGSGDNGGVHYNSGVQNFFFYLLCEGGTGTNDTIGYSVTGIAVTNAERIAYRALTVYCTEYTDYTEARSAWVSAALDFTNTPNWVTSVTQAWAAIDTATDISSSSLGDAVDASSLTWYTGGISNWFSETTITHDGVDAAQSGDIGNGAQSRIYTTVSGPGIISFWWKVSSETNYDFLRFYIDDTEQTNMSGEVDWQKRYYAVTNGDNILYWQYTKDQSVSTGSDAGWLDQVSWPSDLTTSASDGTYVDKIAVTWNSVGNITAYEVWRSQYPQTDFSQASLLATTSSTNYNDFSNTAGILYYYWVNVIIPGPTSVLSSADSGWRSWLPAMPTGVSATDGTYTDKISVTWTASTNALTYNVYRNTSNDSASATELENTSSTNHDDTTASESITYYYWVKSVNDRDNVSKFSTPDTGWRASMPEPEPEPAPPSEPAPDAPTWISATDGAYSDKVRVSWAASSNATSYLVRRNTVNASASATLLATTSATGCDDSTITLNSTYYYWVKAKNAQGESGFSPGDSGYASLTPTADLRATDFEMLPDVIRARASPEQVSVRVSNQGPNSMTGSNSWVTLSVYLSSNETFGDEDDISMGSVSSYMSMSPGQTTDVELSFADRSNLQVPSSVSTGFYTAFLRADHTLLADPETTNNIARRVDSIEVTVSGGLVRNDFDGDGKTDLAVYHEASGYWFMILSGSGTLSYQQFGESGYEPVPGDFDGDGKTDMTVYHEASGYWFITLSSSDSLLYQKFGETGYLPVSGDFNGDWKTDLAVYHEVSGYWYITLSGIGSTSNQKLGESGYEPVPGDFDGDGKTDLAVYHEASGYWFITLSSSGSLSYQKFGETGYTPVSGDFDGDWKTDLAVYHEASGYWFILLSGKGILSYQIFGASGYQPVPGDFDGDGKTDLAVYHESTGYWYVLLSSNYTISYQKLGETGYSPVW